MNEHGGMLHWATGLQWLERWTAFSRRTLLFVARHAHSEFASPVNNIPTGGEKGPGQAQYLVVLPPSTNEASIDISSLLKLLWTRSWIIAIAALVAGGAVALYALNQPNIFRAATVVAIRTEDGMGQDLMRGQLGGLASLAGVNLGSSGGERDELIATLTSRSMAEKFIREKQIIKELFWDKRTADGRWIEKEPTIGEAVDRWLEDTISVSEDRKTGLITVAVEDVDRQRAAAWANAYVELANRTARARQIEESTRTINYLRQQISANPLEGVRQGLYRLIESNINRAALARVRDDYPYSFVDRAVPPEPKKKVRPKRTLMVVIGALAGAILASLILMIRGRGRFIRHPESPPQPSIDYRIGQENHDLI